MYPMEEVLIQPDKIEYLHARNHFLPVGPNHTYQEIPCEYFQRSPKSRHEEARAERYPMLQRYLFPH